MVCYLNMYVLHRVGSEEFEKVLHLVQERVRLEPREVVKSVVVPNMVFARFACNDKNSCLRIKEDIEDALAEFPWVKVEVVCP